MCHLISLPARLYICLPANACSVWDTASWSCRFSLAGHSKAVFSVLISDNGLLLISAARDYSLRCGGGGDSAWQHDNLMVALLDSTHG